MFAIRVLALTCICSAAFAQLSQEDACKKFSSAVVQINAGGSSYGSGFLVSEDGWIFTAAHVIYQEDSGKPYATFPVVLSDGRIEFAKLVTPIDAESVGRDYAILKIEGKNLPHLDLGEDAEEISLGMDLTVIGVPFSAFKYHSSRPSIKDIFCLSGTVASAGLAKVPVSVNTPKGPSTVNVKVDVVYFQGPSVKGLSGSPIISRKTGHVISILTSRLTGIDDSLLKARQSLTVVTGGGTAATITVNNTDFTGAVSTLIDVLDLQIANGLGAGTGIEDPKASLRSILRKRRTRTN